MSTKLSLHSQAIDLSNNFKKHPQISRYIKHTLPLLNHLDKTGLRKVIHIIQTSINTHVIDLTHSRKRPRSHDAIDPQPKKLKSNSIFNQPSIFDP